MSRHHFLTGSDMKACRMASIGRYIRRNISASVPVVGRNLLRLVRPVRESAIHVMQDLNISITGRSRLCRD